MDVTVRISYSDGRYYFVRVPDGTSGDEIHTVPETTVRMWEAVRRLEKEVDTQLRQLDDSRILGED